MSMELEIHDPDLYRHDRTADRLDGLQGIGEDEVELFREQGYLAVANAFTEEEISAAMDGFMHLALGRHREYGGFDIEPRARDAFESLSGDARIDSLRKLMFFVNFDERLHALAYHPDLLDTLRRLMGSDELEMFQDMALIKPPRIGREKPWHQDCAYFKVPPTTPVVGVWIALDPVSIENGCMHVLHGAHKEGPQIHFHRRDWQICDTDSEQLHSEEHPVVAVPLEPGGCLFFAGLLPHGTPHNFSDSRRRALQYHYRPTETPEISQDDMDEIYGSEGKDAEC